MLTGTSHYGQAHWTVEGDPGSIIACNCTVCRRYGELWAYDCADERIAVSGPVSAYTRAGKADLAIDRFDGLDKFDDLPSDGRCVRDVWF